MEQLPIIIISIVIIAVVAFVLWRKLGKGQYITMHGVRIPKKFPYEFRTHGGVLVRSVVDISVGIQAWIDEGIQRQIDAVGRLRPTWTACRRLSGYTVLLVEPMSYYSGDNPTIQGAPQLNVSDGRTASGMCIGTGDTYSEPCAVIPHQAGQAWRFPEYFINSVRYESEHLTMWANDRAMYYQYQGGEDVHPIFGD